MHHLKNTAAKAVQIASKPAQSSGHNQSGSQIDQYKNFRKEGPELFITKILMVNGPLTSKEIWRIYDRKLVEAKKNGT